MSRGKFINVKIKTGVKNALDSFRYSRNDSYSTVLIKLIVLIRRFQKKYPEEYEIMYKKICQDFEDKYLLTYADKKAIRIAEKRKARWEATSKDEPIFEMLNKVMESD